MQEPLDSTTALIYRKMLYPQGDGTDLIPESLLAIHRRMWKLMDGLGGRSRIDVPSAACVTLVWQQTTEEGQDFLMQQNAPAEDVPTRVMTPGESVDWRNVPENADIVVVDQNANVTAKYLCEHGDNQLRVKIPGMAGKYRVVERENVKLISVS